MNGAWGDPQVIDLLSDDEDVFYDYDDDSGYEPDAVPDFGPVEFENEENWVPNYDGFGLDVAAQPGPLGFELAREPDVDFIRPRPAGLAQPDPVPAPNPAHNNPMDVEVDIAPGELLNTAACLQMVVQILPDISIDYVLALIADLTQDNTPTPEACQRIVTKILDDEGYPKEEEEATRKRKRERSVSDFEEVDGNRLPPEYKDDAVDLLKDEFVHVPVRHIQHVIKEHKTFYRAYGVIEEQLRDYSRNTPFTKVIKARVRRGTEVKLIGRGSQMPKELQAAKKKCEEAATKRRKAEDASREEEDNLREAVLTGDMTECQCCFDEIPLNRTIGCGGATMHFFCKECVKKYVESEIGSSRCRPVCFADPTCGGGFTRKQLQNCLADTTFDRLERMQQMQELEKAGLTLDECPFCDFRQECPPVEEDKEFRCLNPKCQKTSCRLCQKETHIPLSCEEAKKDEKLTVRHIVEEAMSAALIRNCNKCKRPFIKELGCNKMSCSHCGNQQCYVCSQDIRDYNHFSDYSAGRTGCQLHDNVENRHEREVKKAADEAMAKAKVENPGLSDADIIVEVSDRVKRAEQQRLGRAQLAHQGFNFHMAGGALVHRAPPANPPAAPAPAVALAQQQYVPAPHFQPLAAIVPHQQHIFLHQPQMFPQAQFNAAPALQANLVPPPLQPLLGYPAPAQRPPVGVVPLQPLQAPNPLLQQQPRGYDLLDLAQAPFRLFQGLAGRQQARPAEQAQAPGYVPRALAFQQLEDDPHRALRANIIRLQAENVRRVRMLGDQFQLDNGRPHAPQPPPAGQRNLLD
ncbi:uncharacterized protein N0V89_006230 [Didymosphaeria variabile]|uniref:RING-type domain-containing protein n=1 Tax=Didymosphaeria variabile TaxID=1932322 RepID=A0A9W8XNP6_9PLEO|nr:uncharacterized protein N0V89_006230 [Didymosphaeria variabile]KAJ4354493.1 hypothetical protein N0V89_006230 [Didymosphaeria variabile]